jgi:hypothetical protein
MRSRGVPLSTLWPPSVPSSFSASFPFIRAAGGRYPNMAVAHLGATKTPRVEERSPE